ncbi:MAG: hypothetical protein H6683_07475 [Deltaproteobacteria bacterium]|nr:hypothetical protein [Deltaproteobacteria bacterium]
MQPPPERQSATMATIATEYELRLFVQNALLGEISNNLRAVLIAATNSKVIVDFYYDGEISEDDWESARYVTTEIVANFDRVVGIDTNIHRLDEPIPIPQHGYCVYMRKE